MIALYRVRHQHRPTLQLITLEVKDQAQAMAFANRLREELRPVSQNDVELLTVVNFLQEANSLFEVYELAMGSHELREARAKGIWPRSL
jgi:hypothetical protein